ncbi:MAG: tryptophan--tRNA ligase [Tidjanibacter sp.]|nr:tryptophan--tRNA ligase [Tidjanibacter sp.]MBR3682524.1 tryptophan--tRNA ligase [Tidjanibacter sp.]MBR3853417.1 tryptophan--tRNA ligase [Tidjanibacter sp.]MBR3931320.1 tryptophan--tRNA ligase [Tidjanibacter sp.]MBR7129678.1 tryptophan--tRNA ligase [Tidjanibacter sp.]
MKKRVLSGIRSTGQLHLGNYFGALRNFVKLQEEAECFFFIADYHSLTTHPDPTILHGNVKNILSEYLAAGIDPEKATIYIQSDVPQVAELSLLLGMHAYVGELERTASFKDKVRKNPNNVNIGLLNYPVLMAADILLHRADYVPVGKDQEQHLEMTRKLAHRFNQLYKTDFFNEEVAAYNFGKDLVKIPGLDGSGKMGKSEGNGIYLSDPDNVIRKKVMKAVTDSGPTEPNSPISEPIQNIFTIMESVSTPDTIAFFKEKYASCEIRYGDLKKQLAEDIIAAVAPIRERIEEIRSNDKYLHEVTALGAEKARKSAQQTVDAVREIMGIYSF